MIICIVSIDLHRKMSIYVENNKTKGFKEIYCYSIFQAIPRPRIVMKLDLQLFISEHKFSTILNSIYLVPNFTLISWACANPTALLSKV